MLIICFESQQKKLAIAEERKHTVAYSPSSSEQELAKCLVCVFFRVPKKRGKGCDIGNLQCNPENIDSQLTAGLAGIFQTGLSLPPIISKTHTVVKEKKNDPAFKKPEVPIDESNRKRLLAVFSANLRWLFHFDVWGKPLIFLSGNYNNSQFLYMIVSLLILICSEISGGCNREPRLYLQHMVFFP